MGNRSYDADLKREAVRMVQEEGRRVRDVERSLGITFGLLKRWIRDQRLRDDEAGVAFTPSPGAAPAERLKQLEKENERLRRERDILKKAVAIFSTEPNRHSGS